MAFYAACWLVVYYLAAGIVKRIVRFGRGAIKSQMHGAPAAVAIVGLLSLLLARSGVGRRPARADRRFRPTRSSCLTIPLSKIPWRPSKAPSAEAKPGAAKHEAKVFGADKSQKMLVPYKKYLELQRAAHPDEIVKPTPPAEYALAGGQFHDSRSTAANRCWSRGIWMWTCWSIMP